MKGTKIAVAASIGIALWGCAIGWTYENETLEDGTVIAVRHQTDKKESAGFSLRHIQEVKMPNGEWIRCFGKCSATYERNKARFAATAQGSTPGGQGPVGGGGGGGGGGEG